MKILILRFKQQMQQKFLQFFLPLLPNYIFISSNQTIKKITIFAK